MEIILNKFYFLKGFEDIIVFFLFTLDILLFTRIPNLFKRGRPFLKRYTRNFILYSKYKKYIFERKKYKRVRFSKNKFI